MYIQARTFNTERTTNFIFYFCIGLVNQFNGSALGVLKHHYIAKRIRELLIGNSKFLIHNSLNQLFYCKDIKESCFFVAKIVETLDLKLRIALREKCPYLELFWSAFSRIQTEEGPE